jgi:hypothetical protein
MNITVERTGHCSQENVPLIFFWSGGTERVINTKSTTVVEDIVEDLCNVIGKSIECKVEERQS